MKQIFIFAFAALISGLFGCASLESETATAQTRETKPNQSNKTIETRAKPAVLVELFTSEGCSSCPPADRVLSQLEKQTNGEAEIITLAFHVDYWNYLGWKDEFSQKHFSERQNGYAGRFNLDSIYTPQMVVDGETQFVGSNLDTANKAISGAAKNQKATVEISNADDKLKVKISDLPAHDESYIWLAVAEDDLKTNVRGGENVGKTLDHVSIVREMKLLGNLLAADETFEIETALQLNSAWKRENLKFVVFVQGKESKKVFGIRKLDN